MLSVELSFAVHANCGGNSPDMQKWNLVIDIAKCTNCNLCVLASQDEHVGNAFPGYAEPMPKHGARWISIDRKERGQGSMVDVAFMPVMCQHCDNAPCIDHAEGGAISKRSDGIVIIDPEKAKGQRHLVDSSPYGAIWWNAELEIPQHWIFDAHLLDQGWRQPRAASVCATEAIVALKCDDREMAQLAEDEELETLKPELNTNPRVYYKNLYRVNKAFIGGSVESTHDSIIDCVEGAKIILSKNGAELATTTTDIYGDFKFDQLEEQSGEYLIEIDAEGSPKKTITVELIESVVLQEIRL